MSWENVSPFDYSPCCEGTTFEKKFLEAITEMCKRRIRLMLFLTFFFFYQQLRKLIFEMHFLVQSSFKQILNFKIIGGCSLNRNL